MKRYEIPSEQLIRRNLKCVNSQVTDLLLTNIGQIRSRKLKKTIENQNKNEAKPKSCMSPSAHRPKRPLSSINNLHQRRQQLSKGRRLRNLSMLESHDIPAMKEQFYKV